MSGVEATKAICKNSPRPRSSCSPPTTGRRTFIVRSRLARAPTCSRPPPATIIETIRGVHAGERRISPAVGARLADRMARPELTSREIDVLGLIVKGRSNKEIARTGDCGGHGKAARRTSAGQLGVSDRTQATTTALQRGIIHLD